MNTPVSFEIAKLLKEKGLDIEKPNFYNSHGQLKTTVQDFFIPRYEAPTIAEVVMWLYEKHGIWIYSVKSKYGWLGCVKDYSNEDLKLIYTTHSEDMFLAGESDKWYNSPTEAYSQAIEYTLKNLI